MQLNIKDVATIELARTLARRRGKSVTATIREALEQVEATQDRDIAMRTATILAQLGELRHDVIPQAGEQSSREIIKQFHEQEWQEQYGRDEWL